MQQTAETGSNITAVRNVIEEVSLEEAGQEGMPEAQYKGSGDRPKEGEAERGPQLANSLSGGRRGKVW